ncbi:MAG: glycosyltransferase family 2 protein [Deltaproteobacteria bacterium]|nr:glycosyltransferase family 2 protein [Deltaproteobacteria bacterium]
MLHDKTVAVVIPAYNVEALVGGVVDTIPDFVDRIYVVDDRSADRTAEVARVREAKAPRRVTVLRRGANGGVGAAIATGYEAALADGIDVTAVMAGDAQMDPADLHRVVGPVCCGEADYVKGNRLFRGESWKMIPKTRYIGNSFLSLLTKIASGYWHVADSQTGYTAISKIALERIGTATIYPRYGMPNDVLIKLNVHNFRVRDVSVRPVYNVGEKSGIKLRKVVLAIPWLLLKGFWWRLFWKYVIYDFHPLVFFYLLGLTLTPAGFLLGAYLLVLRVVEQSHVTATSAMFAGFLGVSGLQTLFFAMWFDMDYNKNLR